MTEIVRRAHFRDEFRDQIGRAAVAVAADAIARTIRPGDFKTAHRATAIGKKRADRGVADDGDRRLFGRETQPVNQFNAGAARQAVYAARGMAGIIEIVHQAEWKIVMIREPLDCCAGLPRYEFCNRRGSFVVGFSLYIGGELLRAVADPKRALKPRGGGWYQACRQRSRATR